MVELESCKINPSVGSFALTSSLGTRYLNLYIFSSNPRLSSLLLIYEISKLSIVPAAIAGIIVFPAARVCKNQLLFVVSYWSGWPGSLGALSDTLLTILNLSKGDAIVLIGTGVSKLALVLDDATLISFADRVLSPAVVIAK